MAEDGPSRDAEGTGLCGGPMKTKNVTRHDVGDLKTNNFKNGAFLAPHRTIDDSPGGAPEATLHVGLRDPLRAPAQLRREERDGHSRPARGQRPEEVYGATEIPGSGEPHVGGDLERKNIDKGSQRPAGPQNQHEKQAEKEQRGLEKEFGRE